MNDLPVREGYARWAPLYDDDGNPLTALEGPTMMGWFGNDPGTSTFLTSAAAPVATPWRSPKPVPVVSALDWTPADD